MKTIHSTIMIALFFASSLAPAATRGNGLTAQNRQDHVFFPNGGTELSEAARAQIATIAEILATPDFADSCVALVGHSDASGGRDVNLTISQDRARQVANSFREVLTLSDRIISVSGVAFDAPLTTLDATDPYQRRVAIYLRKCAEPIN